MTETDIKERPWHKLFMDIPIFMSTVPIEGRAILRYKRFFTFYKV